MKATARGLVAGLPLHHRLVRGACARAPEQQLQVPVLERVQLGEERLEVQRMPHAHAQRQKVGERGGGEAQWGDVDLELEF